MVYLVFIVKKKEKKSVFGWKLFHLKLSRYAIKCGVTNRLCNYTEIYAYVKMPCIELFSTYTKIFAHTYSELSSDCVKANMDGVLKVRW